MSSVPSIRLFRPPQPLVRMRRMPFTSLEFLKTFATSGSSTTIFVPLAKLFAYFPLTPFEKSYSAFMSVSLVFALLFFICSPFPPGCQARADDSNRRSPLSMRYDRQPMSQGLSERGTCFFKWNTVLRAIEAGFGLVPAKDKGHATKSQSTSMRLGGRSTSPS